MHPIASVAALVAALVHVWFFAMESVWFLRPTVWRRFGVASDQEARADRSWAYNQGFYNLFLAAGVAIGLALVAMGDPTAGRAIVLFACGSMVVAALVLVAHRRELLRAAILQGLPPLIAVLGIAFLG
jgi:putative membrane protein